MPLDLCSTLKPMKLVEHADGMMEDAERRFRDHQSNMRSGDRDVAEDQLISARDFRDGVERKLWPNRAEQARRYYEQAQAALAAVKKAVERADEIRNRRGAFYEFAVIVEG